MTIDNDTFQNEKEHIDPALNLFSEEDEEVHPENHQGLYEKIKDQPKICLLLHDLINELKPVEKEIIQKKFWENKSDDEIGYELGLQTRVVDKTLNSCLQYLRERILNEIHVENNVVSA